MNPWIFFVDAFLVLLSVLFAEARFGYQDEQTYLSSTLTTNPDGRRNITLTSLGEDFSHFSHPAFPGRSVRVKKTRFCDLTVNSYTGYIDIGVKHLFFYFFESRSNPSEDEVIFWSNGGPGASSAMGLFMEIGPCTIVSPNKTKYNPYSWNNNANIFFIDQPVGTGFSYADYGETLSTSEDAARDIVAFVAIFFEIFSEFKGRGFHLSGESFAGRFLPVYASAIYDQNAFLIQKGLSPINLKSVLIGNGATDFSFLWPGYYDMQCSTKTYLIEPFQTISECVKIRRALPRCSNRYEASCIQHFDLTGCSAAFEFCSQQIVEPYLKLRRNAYDVSMVCEEGECYPQQRYYEQYLNRKDIRDILGIDESFGNFIALSRGLNSAFWATGDGFHQNQHYIAELLERDIRVLIYVGEFDFACNWIGNEQWTLGMEWSGQEGYIAETLREWQLDGRVAGKTRAYSNFTFATIRGAGHLAPHDKPREALAMLNRWLAEVPF